MSLVVPGKGRTVPLDPDGQRVRDMLATTPPNAALPPSMQGMKWYARPDGSYGPSPAGGAPRAFDPGFQAKPLPNYGNSRPGMTWLPGYGWVPADSPAVKQIEQGMELQQGMLDLEREKLAMEREQMERQTGLGADLRGWLAKKMGGGA